MPVVGFINFTSAQNYRRQLAAFLKGLGETGYIDGRNVAIEYCWAEGQSDRLPAMVADLIHKKVACHRSNHNTGGGSGKGGDHDHSDRF